jgi:hypothetical protein
MDSHASNPRSSADVTTKANDATMAYWKGNAPDVVVSPMHDNAGLTVQSQTEAVESRRPSDSSFASAVSGQENVGTQESSTFEPITKSVSDPMGGKHSQDEGARPDRSGSATASQNRPYLAKGSSKNRTERPAYTQRTSTLMEGLRRGATYSQLQSTRNQYSYTFDPMSSDSESSSSSEDEAHVKKKKASKQEKEGDGNGWDGT